MGARAAIRRRIVRIDLGRSRNDLKTLEMRPETSGPACRFDRQLMQYELENHMNRREFNAALAAASALSLANMAQAQGINREEGPSYAMLIHPKMVLQDLVGPLTVFNLTMGMNHLVWKDTSPVPSELGISVTPTHTFDTCPRDVDVLFVPGGLAGTVDMMQDAETLDFLRDMAPTARYVTSVCTGTLVLGAAGLIEGKRATSHWYTRDMLPLFGATPVEERVVQDGNLITGGGVTAGIDFGFTIASQLRGEAWAKRVMLTLEYDPAPPFVGGSPASAETEHVQAVLNRRGDALANARTVAEAAAARL